MAAGGLQAAVPRILWAEPSDHDRMFIQALLGQLPGRPRTEFVGDGDELLGRLGTASPGSPVDLVVLDLPLPGATGLEVLSNLAGRPGAPPVIVFTAAEGAATLEACRRLGAAGVVRKPDDYRHFREAVLRIASAAWTRPERGAAPTEPLQVGFA